MNWNKFDDARPYPSVIGFIYNRNTRKFPIFWRTDKVRSVKNVWSMPCGLCEVGSTVAQNFAREAKEELNLTIDPALVEEIGIFDAIPGDGWHWLMVVVACPIDDFRDLDNLEPEKHDKLRLVNLDDLYDSYINQPWGLGMKDAFEQFQDKIYRIVSV